MTSTYSVIADPARDLIRIRVTGLFDIDSINDFSAAFRAALAQLRCGPNQHLTLADTRDVAIQMRDMVERWGAFLANPATRSRRLGFVVAPTLARAQLQRATASRASASSPTRPRRRSGC